jgi:hypothetical protein
VITEKDFERLAGEIIQSKLGPGDWCKKHGIERNAIEVSIWIAYDAIQNSLEEPDKAAVVITRALGQMFRLGWEVRDQYGEASRERDS